MYIVIPEYVVKEKVPDVKEIHIKYITRQDLSFNDPESMKKQYGKYQVNMSDRAGMIQHGKNYLIYQPGINIIAQRKEGSDMTTINQSIIY